jgi:hypothetical protein
MEQPIPSSVPAAAPVENDIGIDIDKLIADAQAPTPAAASDDFSDLERQIQALLSGESVEADSIQPVDRKIAEQALEQASVDPLMQEIDAALSDDADSLLKDANGDIDSALRSVFDERVLSGQEEEVNRALIEAFGTSRAMVPSFASAAITNPLSNFDGAARELPSEVLREERDLQAANVVASAGHPKPDAKPDAKLDAAFDASSAKVPDVSAAVATPTKAETLITNQTSASAKSVDANIAGTHAQPVDVSTMAAGVSATVVSGSDGAARAAVSSGVAADVAAKDAKPRIRLFFTLISLPLRALAAPMHAIPASARMMLSIATITLVVWTPAAWWMANRAAQTPVVAPIRILAAIQPPAAASAGAHAPAEKPAEKPAAAHAPAAH